ncbi:MAG: methyltransferase domain-containing protein [Thermoleophilaceae bacterium]|nr:methyltransferase domain-containing protein [Thermoleophilaceae bacterium]
MGRGLGRTVELFGLWRNEKTDPEPFYSELAADTALDLEERVGPLRGQRVLDLGCGPGIYAQALRDRGAEVVPIDNSLEEMSITGPPPEGAIEADAGDLPLPDEDADGVFCSNLLEHTPDADAVIREIERVLKPGGWAYISWTNWYSPWGGHDMTPYQYLGPERGPRLYEKRNGPPRKNPYGDGLWACHIGPTLKLVESRPALAIDRVEPRYWPKLTFITRIPGFREVFTWNCVIRVTKLPRS